MTKSSYGSIIGDGTDPLIASQDERDVEKEGGDHTAKLTLGESDNGRSNDSNSISYNDISSNNNEACRPIEFNLKTRFAADRTYLAADRTAVAWVRTAMAMIGFGITLAKGADILESEGVVDDAGTLYAFGVLFVATAWFGLVLVIVQNVRLERRIAASGYAREESGPLGLMMAVFMLVVCAVGIVIVFRDEFGIRR